MQFPYQIRTGVLADYTGKHLQSRNLTAGCGRNSYPDCQPRQRIVEITGVFAEITLRRLFRQQNRFQYTTLPSGELPLQKFVYRLRSYRANHYKCTEMRAISPAEIVCHHLSAYAVDLIQIADDRITRRMLAENQAEHLFHQPAVGIVMTHCPLMQNHLLFRIELILRKERITGHI